MHFLVLTFSFHLFFFQKQCFANPDARQIHFCAFKLIVTHHLLITECVTVSILRLNQVLQVKQVENAKFSLETLFLVV